MKENTNFSKAEAKDSLRQDEYIKKIDFNKNKF